METIVTVGSLVIAFVSCMVAIMAFSRNKDNDTKQETKEDMQARASLTASIRVLDTKLESIDGGIRDLKAENRNFRDEIGKMKETLRQDIKSVEEKAIHALELAEASHRRLDRAGVDKDPAQGK